MPNIAPEGRCRYEQRTGQQHTNNGFLLDKIRTINHPNHQRQPRKTTTENNRNATKNNRAAALPTEGLHAKHSTDIPKTTT